MSNDEEATARTILAALGLEPAGLSRLRSGFASEAWLVRRAGQPGVLRIATDPADPAETYVTEHALLAHLAAAGAPVPVPVAGNWQVEGWQLGPFSLTSFVPGVPLRADAHAWAAEPIAGFLRLLHAIPAAGFGPLVVRSGRFAGRRADPEAGLLAAFEGYSLWPFGGARLADHPALRDRLGLVADISGQAGPIRSAALAGPAVIVHSDLHEENILQDGDRLAFIDFGEAFVAAAEWDLAAIAYFGGWPLAERVIAAYGARGGDTVRRPAAVTALALCFSLFRWEQDGRLGLNDPAWSEAFLGETLARLSP